MIVKYFAYYRTDAGCKEEKLTLSPLSAIELLRHLGTLHGKALGKRFFTKDGEDIHPDVIFLLNGRNIDFLSGKYTLIREEDIVSLFPRIAGG